MRFTHLRDPVLAHKHEAPPATTEPVGLLVVLQDGDQRLMAMAVPLSVWTKWVPFSPLTL